MIFHKSNFKMLIKNYCGFMFNIGLLQFLVLHLQVFLLKKSHNFPIPINFLKKGKNILKIWCIENCSINIWSNIKYLQFLVF